MKRYKILAGDTAHYTNLVNDYKNYMAIITYTRKITELEDINTGEFVAIYNRDEMTGLEIKTNFNY